MDEILVTGGSGFFGGVLKRRLLQEGYRCVSIDLLQDRDRHPALRSLQIDLRDAEAVRGVFAARRFRAVCHCAAMLGHSSVPSPLLWSSNVEGTRNLAEACREFGVTKFVFTSTNCLWARNLHHPVDEDEPPDPIEAYGKSKLAGERILAEYAKQMSVIVLRCPTIIDSGRLGLLAILFEFIEEGRKVWVVGDGANRYQFVYAQDLASCALRALDFAGSETFNVGADDVKPLRTVYEAVIADADSSSRIASVAKAPAIAAMRLAYALKLSPLGPYHYRMIAEDFIFDTAKVKKALGWRPTLNNEEMLIRAFRYYREQKRAIEARSGMSAHCAPTPMRAIRLLKWLS